MEINSGSSSSHANTYFEKGVVALQNSAYQESIEYFTQAIALYPYNANAYQMKGVAQAQIREYEKATQSFTQAIALDPCCVDAYLARAIVREMQGNLEGAIQDLRNIVSLHSQGENVAQSQYEKALDILTSLEAASKSVESDETPESDEEQVDVREHASQIIVPELSPRLNSDSQLDYLQFLELYYSDLDSVFDSRPLEQLRQDSWNEVEKLQREMQTDPFYIIEINSEKRNLDSKLERARSSMFRAKSSLEKQRGNFARRVLVLIVLSFSILIVTRSWRVWMISIGVLEVWAFLFHNELN